MFTSIRRVFSFWLKFRTRTSWNDERFIPSDSSCLHSEILNFDQTLLWHHLYTENDSFHEQFTLNKLVYQSHAINSTWHLSPWYSFRHLSSSVTCHTNLSFSSMYFYKKCQLHYNVYRVIEDPIHRRKKPNYFHRWSHK